METAQPVRQRFRPVGLVDRIQCPNCKMQRWDDGKACSSCGEYARPWIRPDVKQRCIACKNPAVKFVFGLAVCGHDSLLGNGLGDGGQNQGGSMNEKEFVAEAIRAGFNPSQAAFLWQHTAQKPHEHLSEEIIVDPADGETLEDFVSAVSEALQDDETEESEVEA